MSKSPKDAPISADLSSLPVDGREALDWFVSNFGLYQGSLRGLFFSDFSEEHEASLEASIIQLKSRGFNPMVVSGETLAKQAEFLYDQSCSRTTFGRPVASKLELDLVGSEIVILKDIFAPEDEKQLWYFHNHVIYPRVLAGKTTLITTSLAYEEFLRYGAQCPDTAFAGSTLTWEKLFWLIEASMLDLELFRQMRQQGLSVMLKAEYYLWMSLRERGLNVVAQHVIGDYMLDFALVEKNRRLDIEVDGLATVGGWERQKEESKRNLVLLADGWQILRFTTAEVLNNYAACAEVVEEVWRSGRKKLSLGRLVTGQSEPKIPQLDIEDSQQIAAITHGGGPAAVIGGAGTGKTTCIIQRINYLLSQGVSPDSMLVISHSAETLNAIKVALEGLVDKQQLQRMHLWEWHDLGQKILKENLTAIKRKPPLKIEPNPQKIIQRILSKCKKDLDPTKLELSFALDEFAVAAAISIYKANLVSPQDVKQKASDEFEELIARVYQGYEDQLQRANRIDRDDMVYLAVRVLMDRPEVRAKYQCHFDFVLIDEYQDASLAEDTLARILALPQDNLYFVGDEDESVYETKGAQPRLLTEISHRLPQTRCYTLEKNWRSYPAIVDHARQLLTGLKRRRTQKELVPARTQASASAIVGPNILTNEKEEADWVASEIQILADGGRDLSDIAVLYRYHRYGAILEESLSRRGVSCLASHPEAGLVPDEVEDMLAFLKLVADPDGPKAKESFERACQLRVKEVDPKLSSTISSFAEANNLSYLKAVEIYSEATVDQSCRELEQLVRIIRTMHQENLPPSETISLIRRTQRLNEYYRSVHVPPGVIYEPLKMLTRLEEEARKFKTVAEFLKSLSNNKQQLSGSSNQEQGVSVLSLHEAKGREFAVVFIVGLAEGLFPAQNAADQDEERRLCYTGITRARDLLYLSCPRKFNETDLEPSRFLVEARLMVLPLSLGNTNNTSVGKVVSQSGKTLEAVQTRLESASLITSQGLQGPKAPAHPKQAPLPAVANPTLVGNSQSEQFVVSKKEEPLSSTAEDKLLKATQKQVKPAEQKEPQDCSGGQDIKQSPENMDKPKEVLSGIDAWEATPEQTMAAAQESAYAVNQPQCPHCASILEAGARFCGECGYKLVAQIPACTLCGSPLDPNAKFCGDCGTRVLSGSFHQALSPGGLPIASDGKTDQHGWVVKLLKFLES